ncbi:MAG: hypothetical protein ACPGQD_04370 [Planctomycetota bacterium]
MTAKRKTYVIKRLGRRPAPEVFETDDGRKHRLDNRPKFLELTAEEAARAAALKDTQVIETKSRAVVAPPAAPEPQAAPKPAPKAKAKASAKK